MKAKWMAFALVCAFVSISVSAGDAEKKKVVVKKEVKEVKTEKKYSGSTGGFKGFWIHTVGGTIGNGLKSGASKIGNTFD